MVNYIAVCVNGSKTDAAFLILNHPWGQAIFNDIFRRIYAESTLLLYVQMDIYFWICHSGFSRKVLLP